MAYNSVHGRYFAGKQVKCEFVSLTRWKVAICGEYMKSRLKTCSRGSACNFLHCFSNPGGDYEWADRDKPPPRYWVKKMTALFGYSDDQPSPKNQQHSTRIFTSDKDSYHYKRHRSIDPSQHNGSSSRSSHEETPARKSRRRERQEDNDVFEDETEYKNNHLVDSYHYRRHRSIDPSQHNGSSSRSYREETHARKSRYHERQEDHNVYQDEMRYKSNHLETDSDEDRLNMKRHGDHSEMHIRSESKPRHNHKRTPDSRGNSSDEDLYARANKKRKSQHRKNSSEPSSNDAKTEPGEDDLTREKPHKTKSTRRRSRHSDRDEVGRQESKKVDGHRPSRSRSHESADKNDTSDRWQPDSEQGDNSSKLDAKDYKTSDDRKPKDGMVDHETRSGSVVEDTSKEIRHSRECDDRTRDKRKRI